MIRSVALRDIQAPPEVDTLRDTTCPVCSSEDSFMGDRCSVCNSPRPPRDFMAPDITRAKDIQRVTEGDPGQVGEGIDPTDPDDFGQEDPDADPDADGFDENPEAAEGELGPDGEPLDDEEMGGEEGGDLVCPVCSSTFHSAEAEDETQQPHLDAAADTVPLVDDPMDEEDPDVDADMEETAFEPGDTCPVCGEGELVPAGYIEDDPEDNPDADPYDDDPEEDDQPPMRATKV